MSAAVTVPPSSTGMGPTSNTQSPRFFHMPKFQGPPQLQSKSFMNFKSNAALSTNNPQAMAFDGKRMRRAVYRKTVDYNSSVINYLQNRVWQRDQRDYQAVSTDVLYARQIVPPLAMKHKPLNCVCTKFIRTSSNKIKCPIFAVCWTPEGRRLITGASSGEFTLWNGLTFNFETILQAHETSVRAMKWSHNGAWMVTGDHSGFVKYWQSNMNNVQMFQAHKEAVRGISFCPTDQKYVSCSDDGTVRIWDFLKCHEERILRGHGADVKCVHWNPLKALVASGSKDTQQPVKLWDPRMGSSLMTIHSHKHTVMNIEWNQNGNWLLSASRDHLVKLYDVRNLKEELQTFKGHKKEAMAVAWHPIHETLFTSGGSDGSIMYWLVGQDKEVGGMDEAHDTIIWSLAWHPLGHILASGSNDHSTKFWSRNRPGDHMRDRYNLNTLPFGMPDDMADIADIESMSSIPGMGLPEKSQGSSDSAVDSTNEALSHSTAIPGLGISDDSASEKRPSPTKKVPYAKPISRSFEAAWETGVHASGEKPDAGVRMRPPGPMRPPFPGGVRMGRPGLRPPRNPLLAGNHPRLPYPREQRPMNAPMQPPPRHPAPIERPGDVPADHHENAGDQEWYDNDSNDRYGKQPNSDIGYGDESNEAYEQQQYEDTERGMKRPWNEASREQHQHAPWMEGHANKRGAFTQGNYHNVRGPPPPRGVRPPRGMRPPMRMPSRGFPRALGARGPPRQGAWQNSGQF